MITCMGICLLYTIYKLLLVESMIITNLFLINLQTCNIYYSEKFQMNRYA